MFEQEQRNHFSVVLERVGGLFVILLSFGWSMLFNQRSFYPIYTKEYWQELAWQMQRGANGFSAVLPPAVVLLGLITAAVSIFRWRRTVFCLQGDALVVERRTLLKKSSRLPLNTIATVNLEENFFERLLGTAKIRLDIDSSVTAQSTDFTFVLKADKARAFRQALLEKRGQTAAAAEEAQSLRQVLVQASPRQAVRHVLLCQPIVPLLLSGLLLWLTDYTDGNRSLERFLPILFLALGGWLVRMALQMLSLWSFTLETDEQRFFLSSGLIAKKSYSFETDKIKAVAVRQPLLSRFFGLCYAEVCVVGMGDDKKETSQICLLMKKEQVRQLLVRCAPNFLCKGDAVRAHKCDFAMTLFGGMLFALPLGALLAVSRSVWLGAVLVGIVVLGCAVGSCTKRFCADEKGLCITRGVWNKSTVMLLLKDVQTAQYRTNALLNRFRVGRIRVSVLARQGMSVHTSAYINKAFFEQVERSIVP
ncbi:MAG TPA: hypothetical protein DDY98_00055 [Ruminococcaceae bacterium]|nr:hypothetical protein [Oscillospiraceae bacterium]